MKEPHGGRLIERVAGGDRRQSLEASVDGPTITLDTETYQDAINIASGRYSPLEGFMTQSDFLKVVEDMALEDGTVWPVPITFDVGSATAESLVPGTRAALASPDGTALGCLDVEEVYTYNESRAAEQIFGTTDRSHPGVAKLYGKDDFLIGGDILLFEPTRYHDSDLFPAETRVLFEHNGWSTVAGFQTRNAPHRAHEYIQKSALELVDGLLIQPKLGDKKANDYTDNAIIGAYRRLIDHYYPDEMVAISSFPSTMRYAGPREAIFDAIVRKNQGCSHFIVGRDHAGVEDYYDEKAAQHIFEEIPDIGIELLFYDYAFYCHKCDGMCSSKTCCHDEKTRVNPSGSRIRKLIRDGERPSDKLMRPEVADFTLKTDSPFVPGGGDQ